MPREPMDIARDVLEDVRAACERSGRPTAEAEVRRVLEGLPPDEVEAVRRTARSTTGTGPLGPDALVEVARGTPPEVASAREQSGYYELRAERDALASIARGLHDRSLAPGDAGLESLPIPSAREQTPPPRDEPGPVEPEADTRPADEQARELITLFAYHRDAVRVAQALGIGTAELSRRIEKLSLKRRIHRLLESTTDVEVFSPQRVRGPRPTSAPAPVVRKRGSEPPRPAEEPPPEPPSAPPEADRTGPAARTEPVNVHGTRVYRRVRREEAPPPPEAAARREYVREPRRGAGKGAKAAREPGPPPRRSFSEMESTLGRVDLERLLSQEKANPRVLTGKLAEQYDGPGGRRLEERDVRAALERHGLAEAFRTKEHENTLFLLGFHQGARNKLAGALQRPVEELDDYLAGLGLTADLERIRAERRRYELARSRPIDRLNQVLTRAAYLDDLGVLPVIDREARDHLEAALSKHTAPGQTQAELIEKTRADLGLEANAVAKLMRRYGLEGSAESL